MTITEPKILIVDDEPALAEVMGRVLTRNGFEVKTAFSGNEGASVALEFMPDLILSDVCMPNGSGYDLLKTVRTVHPKPPPVICLMTGYTDISQEELLKAGAYKVFHKPVPLKELLSVLQSAMSPA